MMYPGVYVSRARQRALRRKRARQRRALLLLVLTAVFTMMVGGTIAYLSDTTNPIVNKFTPSEVTCKVEETFDGKTKTNVNVKNTSNINAYIRVKLISYRVNAAGQHIGGTAEVPEFVLGEGWVKHTDGYYYYTKPVAPTKQPDKPLIGSDGITLQSYDDADGGRQVIEVMAEAIQSVPDEAVGEAWGVTITENGVAPYDDAGGEE